MNRQYLLGFNVGTFLIEPKPMEPAKHQYDVDVETVVGFLRVHGLDKDLPSASHQSSS